MINFNAHVYLTYCLVTEAHGCEQLA